MKNGKKNLKIFIKILLQVTIGFWVTTDYSENESIFSILKFLCTSHKGLNESGVWQLFVARFGLVCCIKFVDTSLNLE